MATDNQTTFTKDRMNNKIKIVREFDTSLEKLWQAYTDHEILDQWWAPKPWRAETKHMDFKEGGYWLYSMVGPNNERHWSRMDFLEISTYQYFKGMDYFCDAEGKKSPDLPTTMWLNKFSKTDNGVKIEFDLTFESEADLLKLVEMGFEEGMAAAIENLVELLAA